MIYLAQRLRELRREAGLTQEDIAVAVNVSPQSVSKWERAETYPDITLLPALANLLSTSTDVLIGMDKISSSETKAGIFKKEQACMRSGDYAGAVFLLREALKIFPQDAGLMGELALALSMSSDEADLREAEELCKTVLTCKKSEKLLHTVRAALCMILLKLGEKEKALSVAGSLPHIRESREKIMEEIEKEPSKEEIDHYLRYIALGDDA